MAVNACLFSGAHVCVCICIREWPLQGDCTASVSFQICVCCYFSHPSYACVNVFHPVSLALPIPEKGVCVCVCVCHMTNRVLFHYQNTESSSPKAPASDQLEMLLIYSAAAAVEFAIKGSSAKNRFHFLSKATIHGPQDISRTKCSAPYSGESQID